MALLYSRAVPADVVTAHVATLANVLPGSAQHLIRMWLADSLARHQAGGVALLVSAAVTLFSARRAGRSLLHGINVANGIEQHRRPLMRQLVALAVVLVAAALLLTALVSIFAMALIENLVPDGLPGAAQAFHLIFWGSLTLGPTAALLFTYRYAAARQPVPWTWVWPGVLAAVLLWMAATLGLRIYVSRIAGFASTYGSLSAVIVLQLWLMLSAFILLCWWMSDG